MDRNFFPKNIDEFIMAAHRFSPVLKYKVVILSSALDIVQHSFIVQNSISHLDLELSQSNKYIATLRRRYFLYNSVINTEEKCRKLHSASSRQLYNLHLDLPKAREWNLKSESLPEYLEKYKDVPCICRIKAFDRFYVRTFVSFLSYACINNLDNEKVLKWFIKLEDLKFTDCLDFPPNVLNNFASAMLAEFRDLEFVKKCLTKLDFKNLLQVVDGVKPERVGDMLYAVRRNCNGLELNIWKHTFAGCCLMQPTYIYVGEILKFLNAPRLERFFLFLFADFILQTNCHLPLVDEAVYSMIYTPYAELSMRRRCLLLHLYWTYQTRSLNPSSASEALRLVWNSVNEAFLSYCEISSKFEGLGPEVVSGIYEFYSKAIGECLEDAGVRPLKHFCRSAIRYRLWKSNQWIPEGIEQLLLPTKLKSYLKLEIYKL